MIRLSFLAVTTSNWLPFSALDEKGRKISATITTTAIIPHDQLVSHYQSALAKAGKQPPSEADIEQLCQDIEEAILARQRGLHGNIVGQGH